MSVLSYIVSRRPSIATRRAFFPFRQTAGPISHARDSFRVATLAVHRTPTFLLSVRQRHCPGVVLSREGAIVVGFRARHFHKRGILPSFLFITSSGLAIYPSGNGRHKVVRRLLVANMFGTGRVLHGGYGTIVPCRGHVNVTDLNGRNRCSPRTAPRRPISRPTTKFAGVVFRDCMCFVQWWILWGFSKFYPRFVEGRRPISPIFPINLSIFAKEGDDSA